MARATCATLSSIACCSPCQSVGTCAARIARTGLLRCLAAAGHIDAMMAQGTSAGAMGNVRFPTSTIARARADSRPTHFRFVFFHGAPRHRCQDGCP
eukprot:13886013-Alexandrium_andersonii.AAC.1